MLPESDVRLKPAYLDAAEELRENPGQWRAYESRGNCVVLAGPGSGKTKTLTIKLARMQAEDVRAPRGIACITYNTECVRELKRRLSVLGVEEEEYVFIGTVHSFCLKHILLPYGRIAGLVVPDPISVASPSEQDKMFVQALAKVVSADEPPSGWRIRADRHRRTCPNRNAPEWLAEDEQLRTLIETYERLLRQKGLVDFDDMVLHGLRLIEQHEWVRQALRGRFPVLVVDEYQDLGVPLHRIVLSLCTKAGIRLFAVGDPDQSIYGFAGSRPELLKELSEIEGIETVRLRFNYRSGKTIVKASEVALGESRGYVSKKGYAGTVDFHECPGGLEEQAELICNSIIPDAVGRRPGRTLGDLAVLYLDRNDGDVIADQVSAVGMDFIRIDKGAPYSKTPLTRWLEDCAAYCSGGWVKGVPRLGSIIGTWFGFNSSIQTTPELRTLKLSLVAFLFDHRLPDLLLRDWLASCERTLLRATLDREPTMRDEAEVFGKFSKACAKGGKLADLTLAGFSGQTGSPKHLNLITLHSAKGLEFDVVIMMGMEQGRLPSWSATTVEAKREPRRLFYVGLTRAKDEVHLTYSGWTVNRYGRRFENGPSEFLLEVQKIVSEA